MKTQVVFVLVVLIALSLLAAVYMNVGAEDLADTAPPTVADLKFTPKLVDAPQTVTASMRIVDNSSGVRDATVFVTSVENPNDYLFFGFSSANRISGTPQDGVYFTTFKVPAGSTLGAWIVEGIAAIDMVGNERFYTVNCHEPVTCIPASNEKGFTIIDRYYISWILK